MDKSKANANNVALKNITKESITQALIMLMDQKDYKDISISEICNKAGVSRNAFYRNYPAKDAILRIYLYEETDTWRRDMRQIKNLSTIQYFSLLFAQCGKFKELTRKMVNAGIDYILIDLFYNFFKDLTRYNDTDSHYYQCHLAGSVYAIFINWVMNERPESAEEIATLLCKYNHISPNGKCRRPKPTEIEEMLTMGSFKYKN